RVGRGLRLVNVARARALHQHGWRALAEPEAGAAVPGRPAVGGRSALRTDLAGQLIAEIGRALHLAGDVVADVGDGRRRRLQPEHGIEARYPVGLGRRDVQALADIV